MDNKNIFAENLNRYMEINGKSRRDVSEAIGVSYYTLTDWVKGKKYPRMDKVEKLAEYFGIMKSDLIEVKESIQADPVVMAQRHIEMITDEDLDEMFDDFKKLDAAKRQIVKDLVHSLAKA